jgi:phenylacetate-CoA ligase
VHISRKKTGMSDLGDKLARVPGLMRDYRSLLSSQWWSRDRLERQQLRHLQELLRFAAANTRFHAERFRRNGFDPATLSSLADLRVLPLLDKAALRDASLKERIEKGLDPETLVHLHTSGSTAEPFEVMLTRAEKEHRVLMDLRALRANGVGRRELLLAFRHLKNVVGEATFDSMLGFYPRRYAPFALPAVQKLETLSQVDPVVLQGHPSTLVPMAELVVARNMPKPPRLKLIVSCTEFLDSVARELIEKAFGVPVMDHYGAIEFGFLAWECPAREGMHVNVEDFVVEIVGPDGEPVHGGQTGEIVVTALRQRAMPLIRYRLGDRARWIVGKCECGRDLPRLRLARGRTVDRLFRSDKSEVNPHVLTVLWEGIEGLRQYQIAQKQYGRITYRYVADPDADCAAIEKVVRKRVTAEFDPGTRVVFEHVSSIPPHVSGKLKYIHSSIKPPVTESDE